jgi:phospholipid transport system substrate-binding protein
MQSHLASWIVVLGIATAVTGCALLEPSGRTRMVNTSNHQWLTIQPATIVIVDGGNRVAPLDYSPTESVKNTITEVLSILGNEALKQPGRVEERRQQIEQVIRHHVNFEQMAQRSLGVPWMRLNDTERQEFVSLFVQLLRDTVANKIDQYYDEQVLYLVEQREGSFAEVRTNLIGPKVDTSLDFRLENHSGDWLVYDVVIDGVSTVRNYRTQFGRIIRDNAYAGLVEIMKQKALSVKWFEKTTPAIALLTTDTSDSR